MGAVGIQEPLFGQLHPAEAAYYAAIAVHRGWWVAADDAMRYLAARGDEFTADDLRHLLDGAGDPPSPNAYGGLLMAWKKRGAIRRVGYTNSRQPRRHGGVNAVWVGQASAPIAGAAI